MSDAVDASAPPRPTLPRFARVRARADFDRVFATGRRSADPLLSLHWLDEPVPARLGLAVSRKVDARAVGRNRIKRVLRTEFRAARATLAAGSYVLVARPPAARADNPALRRALHGLLLRAGALPASRRDGTMPAACPPGASPPSP